MTETVQDLIDQTYAARREEKPAEARRIAEQLLTLSGKSGIDLNRARALIAMGQIERDDGHYEAAIPYYTQAADLMRQLGDDTGLAHAVRHLGDLHQELNLLSEAQVAYEEALGLYRNLSRPPALALANAIRAYAILKEKLSEPDKALALWQQAQSLYDKAGIAAGSKECSIKVTELSKPNKPKPG